MNGKNIVTFVILASLVAGFYVLFSPEDIKPNEIISKKINMKKEIKNNYASLSTVELEIMLKNKDFTLIDVHTPEQRHIPGTNYMISFDEIDKIESVLEDKNTKVVLYCRSGGMSKVAAKDLIERGYTNVFELKKGLNEWVAEEKETLPKGSVK